MDDLIERLNESLRERVQELLEERDSQAATIARLTGEVEELYRHHRWNIAEDGEDLLICKRDHEKTEGCSPTRYVPESRLLTVKKDTVEACARVAEHLNGWGVQPAPDLASHIAKCIRSLGTTASSSGVDGTTGDQRGEIAARCKT